MSSMRAQFPITMLDLMARDESIVVLLGDIGLWGFREHMRRWPLRCINAGVSEQAMVGMAAGMATQGLYPVISTIDSFLARRAYEFIRLDFGEQGLPGLFVTVGHDKDYRALGPSHWCPEGRDLMQSIKDMWVCEPENSSQLKLQMEMMISAKALGYIRMRETA